MGLELRGSWAGLGSDGYHGVDSYGAKELGIEGYGA